MIHTVQNLHVCVWMCTGFFIDICCSFIEDRSKGCWLNFKSFSLLMLVPFKSFSLLAWMCVRVCMSVRETMCPLTDPSVLAYWFDILSTLAVLSTFKLGEATAAKLTWWSRRWTGRMYVWISAKHNKAICASSWSQSTDKSRALWLWCTNSIYILFTHQARGLATIWSESNGRINYRCNPQYQRIIRTNLCTIFYFCF